MTGTNGRSALVTGGHGFLGSHLVQLLLDRGWRVRCLLRPGRDPGVLAGRPVEIARGDLLRREGLAAAVRGVETVFHVAGKVAARGPREFHAVNAGGTRRLVQAAASVPGVARFVLVSSQAAAGPSPDGRPLDGRGPLRPCTHYGRSKLAAERALQVGAGGLAWTILRPPAIYGPRDVALFPFFATARRGWIPALPGRGRRFDLLHARDVAAALLAAAESRVAAGRTYFLAHRAGYSYDDLAAGFARTFGRRVVAVPLPDVVLELAGVLTDEWAALVGAVPVFGRQKAIEFKQRWWLASPAAARRDLGWQARVDLADGLGETARWYVEAGRLRRWVSSPL